MHCGVLCDVMYYDIIECVTVHISGQKYISDKILVNILPRSHHEVCL